MNAPFEEMAIFAIIADKGSFTAAAAEMGRSKAYVSQQITKLEEILGLQLLFRTTRKVSLTESGRVYLGYCQQILQSAEQAKQAVAALQGEMTGEIIITAPNSFGELMAGDVLTKFQDIYPNIKINLDLSDTTRDLKTENVDIAIRGGAVVDEDLVAIPIASRRMLMVGSPEYLQKHGIPKVPEDLMAHNCIAYQESISLNGWPFIVDGKEVRIVVDGDFTVNRNPTIKQLALSGRGLARLPSYVLNRELKSGALIEVLEEYTQSTFRFYLVYLYQKSLPMKNRRMIDFIKSWFQENEISNNPRLEGIN